MRQILVRSTKGIEFREPPCYRGFDPLERGGLDGVALHRATRYTPAERGPHLSLRRYRRIRAVLDRRQPDLTVLMDRVSKSHNFSAILRNCDAVGVLDAHCVLPDNGLDVHRTSSAGTNKWMRVMKHPNIETALEHFQGLGFRLVAAHPSEGSVDYRTVDFTVPTCLLIGAERFGVSEAGLAVADEHCVIPMMGMVKSLNVSVATSLLLFEAFRQRSAKGMYDTPRLDPDLHRRLTFEWAHPRLARECRELGAPYPALDEEGEVLPS